jgi:phytoene desaturase
MSSAACKQSIERRIRHPHLRQLLGRFATYVGASPYLAPATLAVIAHVELTEGVWYPQGGIYAIARAYEKLARELGVEIRLNTKIREICLHGKQVSAVILENGDILPASTLISNLDVTSTYGLIQSERAARRLATLKKRDVSCSGMILLLGVEGAFPDLAHHNIFFSSDYRREFEQIFSERVLPDDPTLYLCITSKTDASHAPEGCENWFVMVNSPPLPPGEGLGVRDKAATTEMILTRLAALGLDVRDKIRTQQLLTPLDIQKNTGAHRGALYGVSFNDRFAPFKRPHNRSEFDGLYFVGGTTHPGGGVPMVTLSGKLVSQMISKP